MTNTLKKIRKSAGMIVGTAIIVAIAIAALAAPLLSRYDPGAISPPDRLLSPGSERLFGTDALGRDLWARTIHCGRMSLLIGLSVAVCASSVGFVLGVVSGYFRSLDSVIMRVMDALMAIPGILLAIAIATVSRPSVTTVIVAISLPEIPRVARLIRSVVLSAKEQLFVEAAVSTGSSTLKVLVRHISPNTFAPFIVQVSYVCASAIVTEAYLSFLGAGIPLEQPSWGNIMAEGRVYFHQAPWIVLIPGAMLGLAVLAINLFGDGLRDFTDPKMKNRA